MYKKIPIILISVLLIIPLIFLACTSNQEFNSKLDFPLEDLIRAEERGEAEEFAQSIDIELVDGNVTIIIECEDGKAEAVAKKASAFGTVELSVRDLVQVVVPITNLTALADISGVHLVRLPWYPVEND